MMTMTTETRVVNINNEAYDIYIGRGTRWGNPYRIGVDGTRSQVIQKYEKHIRTSMAMGFTSHKDIMELDGKTLGCHCRPMRCHGEVLIKIIEEVKSL